MGYRRDSIAVSRDMGPLRFNKEVSNLAFRLVFDSSLTLLDLLDHPPPLSVRLPWERE